MCAQLKSVTCDFVKRSSAGCAHLFAWLARFVKIKTQQQRCKERMAKDRAKAGKAGRIWLSRTLPNFADFKLKPTGGIVWHWVEAMTSQDA